MRISEIFNLELSQAELDFVDIDVETDIPLFLDPFYLGIREDKFSHSCNRTIRSFFQRVIDLVKGDRLEEAKQLFEHLQEPNATCLGLSQGNPQGRGVGQIDTGKIFDRIIESQAIQTGLLNDLEDSVLFVNQFDKDKLSDMTTNIIRRHLINYTINQCRLHSIPLVDGIASGMYWNPQYLRWEAEHLPHLVINHQKILLVPKAIVSFKKEYTAQKYYQHFVLNFLQNEHLRLNSALVQQRANGVKYVTKKSIAERNPYSKDFLIEFTRLHPEVLESFKERTTVQPVTNLEIADIDLGTICQNLIHSLRQIPTGRDDADRYHKLVKAILELIFYPMLINPVLENEIHQGRKRIDITFDNAAQEGLFFRFANNMNLPSAYIMIECKNYSSDPVNPELDQLSGRFSINRGKVGFLLCRNIGNLNLFIERCRDTYRDDRGLIIPITDRDLVDILDNYDNWNSDFIEHKLSNIVRRIAIF